MVNLIKSFTKRIDEVLKDINGALYIDTKNNVIKDFKIKSQYIELNTKVKLKKDDKVLLYLVVGDTKYYIIDLSNKTRVTTNVIKILAVEVLKLLEDKIKQENLSPKYKLESIGKIVTTSSLVKGFTLEDVINRNNIICYYSEKSDINVDLPLKKMLNKDMYKVNIQDNTISFNVNKKFKDNDYDKGLILFFYKDALLFSMNSKSMLRIEHNTKIVVINDINLIINLIQDMINIVDKLKKKGEYLYIKPQTLEQVTSFYNVEFKISYKVGKIIHNVPAWFSNDKLIIDTEIDKSIKTIYLDYRTKDKPYTENFLKISINKDSTIYKSNLTVMLLSYKEEQVILFHNFKGVDCEIKKDIKLEAITQESNNKESYGEIYKTLSNKNNQILEEMRKEEFVEIKEQNTVTNLIKQYNLDDIIKQISIMNKKLENYVLLFETIETKFKMQDELLASIDKIIKIFLNK
jgi:hypothetical protein